MTEVDPRILGMTERRELRALAYSVARVSRLDPQAVLAVLVLFDARGKEVGGRELVKAVGDELAAHRADLRVQQLARMADINHLTDGIPV